MGSGSAGRVLRWLVLIALGAISACSSGSGDSSGARAPEARAERAPAQSGKESFAEDLLKATKESAKKGEEGGPKGSSR